MGEVSTTTTMKHDIVGERASTDGDTQHGSASGRAPTAKGRKAVRFDLVEADSDFDRMVRLQWQAHLRAMRPEIARSKGWGGSCWKAWFGSMTLDSDMMDTVESVEGLPPSAEDDRHARPALHDDQQPGGRVKSKLDVGVGSDPSGRQPSARHVSPVNFFQALWKGLAGTSPSSG